MVVWNSHELDIYSDYCLEIVLISSGEYLICFFQKIGGIMLTGSLFLHIGWIINPWFY